MPHRTDRKFETEGPALRALRSFLKESVRKLFCLAGPPRHECQG